MKSFIVAALLVAAVAGQSMDVLKLKKDITHPLLKFDRSVYPYAYDTPTKYNMAIDNYKYFGDFDYDTTTTTVYQLDEIIRHPLFQGYMQLDLFRQYWSYPMFQRYVASIYFQRYWEIPMFQRYFDNEALFYKYIYPIVQLFKYDETTMNTYNWMWNKNTYPINYNTEYGYDYYHGQNDLFSMYNMPTVCRYNSVYCKALFERLHQHMYSMMTHYEQEEMMPMPYTTTSDMYKYNPYVARMFQGYYDRMYPKGMNTFETTNMIDDVIPTTTTGVRYENMRPFVQRMMGVKNFDKKIMPETIFRA